MQSNALEIINHIKGINHPPWPLESLVKDILKVANDFWHVKFCCIRRNMNLVAHSLTFICF